MASNFDLVSNFQLSFDQEKAVKELVIGYEQKAFSSQVLLGATGTGKTFTMANVIQRLNKKTLVLAHNKTLAAQLWAEFKAFFPNNKVEYFVSAFDFYQPEAYVVKSGTYIEKSSATNPEIEMLNLSALHALAHANDVIVVASVAAIYASMPPEDFFRAQVRYQKNQKISINQVKTELVNLNYQRNDYDVAHGKFAVKGDVVEIGPSYSDLYNYRLSFFGDVLEEIAQVDPLTKQVHKKLDQIILPCANLYVADLDRLQISLQRIEQELNQTYKNFQKQNKLIEAQRIWERTNQDLASFRELGYCKGIENYSRHLELRAANQTPWTIFDYFGNDWLLIIDESHMMIPQIRGMYNTDHNRKQALVDYGFRLPSALDNRPLNFPEFLDKINKVLYVSATPNAWEINQSGQVVEQIIRPTGLVDPVVSIHPTADQISDIEQKIREQIAKKERTFVTVMTIRMAEELCDYLKEKKIKTAYLHNELKTLERTKIINSLRKGLYDVLVGINLLREGLDVPEVSMVLIVDADKPGFFRSQTALIQIIGRASRNVSGKVIMYADTITEAMQAAIDETNRRRNIQLAYNQQHNIVPKTVHKKISLDLTLKDEVINQELGTKKKVSGSKKQAVEKSKYVAKLKKEMLLAAEKQEYEKAAYLRDIILELEAEN